jgi:hypothetical protein
MAHLFAYKAVLFDCCNDEEQFNTVFGIVAAEKDTLSAAVAEVEKDWGVDEVFKVEATRVYDSCGGNVDAAPSDIVEAFNTLDCPYFKEKEKEEKRND